eukprot:TRINITY_DN10456_c0_g1_i1.p1 TRINITY_DN10456_c0_g1~~TRINITY_DN10456_c0_g1_i1.p1  ORF type:complete len:700 (+),score=173.99 TRINITY_DN10456_c0_g1_i1:109-2208(+)
MINSDKSSGVHSAVENLNSPMLPQRPVLSSAAESNSNSEQQPLLGKSKAVVHTHNHALLARDSGDSMKFQSQEPLVDSDAAGGDDAASSHQSNHHKLGQFLATSIAGNDITSSCLYVSGICAYYAGFWAPISLVLVSGCVLYIFRKIYAEVVTALPVNGGTYTLLLNTTSKSVSSLAGCLTLLSYISTAVVGASVAVSYINPLVPEVDQYWGPIGVLAIFALLTFFGLKDSARVAAFIFSIHLIVMAILIVDCFVFAVNDGFSMLAHNFSHRMDALPDGRTPYEFGTALAFGFGSAMLGITGFETSANYVEEQKPGVFPKTLRNMWFCVAFLNPVLSVLSFCVLDLPTVMGYPLDSDGHPNNNALLMEMARHEWLKTLVSIDAFLVLAGSVLTAYVGVNGLLRRMAMDECFPKFLLARNRCFKTDHVIIFGFFGICSSLYYMVDRNVLILASVYAISFLCVMSLFCVGNLILKYKRSRIRRDYRAKVPVVVLALSSCIIAVYINIVIDSSTLKYWSLYYGITLIIVGIMFQKARILHMFLRGTVGKHNGEEIDSRSFDRMPGITGWAVRKAKQMLKEIEDETVVFFIKQEDIRLMNKVVAYVRDNEHCNNIKFVHICNMHKGGNCEESMVEDILVLQRVYPKKVLGLAVVRTDAHFDGKLIRKLSSEMKVPTHRMFISCPSITFPYDIAMLGGVRLITH